MRPSFWREFQSQFSAALLTFSHHDFLLFFQLGALGVDAILMSPLEDRSTTGIAHLVLEGDFSPGGEGVGDFALRIVGTSYES